MDTLGVITLNVSFLLYLFFYLPQLVHNFRYQRLAELSFEMHALLFIAATTDLFYAFGRIEQWQYRTVSLIMFSSVLIQHLHFYCYFSAGTRQRSQWIKLSCLIGALPLLGLLIKQSSSADFPIIMGWMSQGSYWLYCLPQIIKNRQMKNTRSISRTFATIGATTALLDLLSAWLFSWGTPSLYGGFILVLLQGHLLYQCVTLRG